MGHQVNFLMLPTDLPMIKAAIRNTGEVRFLADRTPTAEPIEIATLAFDAGEMGRRPLGAYIARSSELGEVKTKFVETQGYWLIDSLSSPVIEFSPCYFDGNVLRRGRTYFATDSKFRAELPGEDFVTWGDRVLGRIKSALLRVPEISAEAYLSADARQWIEQNHAVGDNLLTFRKAKVAG